MKDERQTDGPILGRPGSTADDHASQRAAIFSSLTAISFSPAVK